MRRVWTVADRFQREIGFDATGKIEIAAVEERPTAMLSLEATDEFRNLSIERVVYLTEVMLQQDVFGRDGRVSLELKAPLATRILQRDKRCSGALDGTADIE
jgi:hypothetical protein